MRYQRTHSENTSASTDTRSHFARRGRPRGTRAGVLAVWAACLVAGAAYAGDPSVTASHVFINLVQLEDGFEAAEYEFTVTNNGATALYDLRFAFGLHAPEPVNPEGEPTMRIEALGPGETTVVYWEVTMPGASSELLAESDLQGWAEAVDTQTGEIVSFTLTSASQGGAE